MGKRAQAFWAEPQTLRVDLARLHSKRSREITPLPNKTWIRTMIIAHIDLLSQIEA
jgi:hypothetical protein